MKQLVPLTKIVLTLAISLAALIFVSPSALVVLVVLELIGLALMGQLVANRKTVGMLFLFAIVLGIVQYIGGGTLESAYVTGLRMLAMTFVFIMLIATTRLQDLTAAMVTQLKIPYEYAFMFTAALRFVPDFIAENKAVLEAQACRGLDMKGNIFKRTAMYLAVVQPMVLKSLSRSETMALSLELRGFGQEGRSFVSLVSPRALDGIVMVALGVGLAFVIFLRLQYGY